MKKLIALVLALALVLLCVGAAFAANTAAEPSGTYASFKTNNGATITISNAHEGQKYEFYQIFEAIPNTTSGTATSVSYKMIGSATMPTNDYFEVDAGGNVVMKGVTANETTTYAAQGSDGKLTSGAIEWLDSVKGTIGRKVAEVTATENGSQTMGSLPFGYYFISTTTGTIVTVDSTMPTASVEDKNPTTTIDKSITGVVDGSYTADDALAEIGKVVNFKAEIPIRNGAVNYAFKDQMSHGLTLGSAVTVKLYNPNDQTTSEALAQTDFAESFTAANVEADTTATAENNDIVIRFKNSWLSANVGKTIVIEYTGTVNASAIVADSANPNRAIVEYGNTDSPLTYHDDVEVYSAKVKIIKKDGTGAALEGAGFVLAKDVTASGTTTRYYYVREADTDTVTWTTDIESATVKTSAIATGETQATAEFKGLANGTYTLIEKVVPPGYNKAADATLTIKPVTSGTDSNDLDADLVVESEVTNNSGTELPSTGGIGTTIFYILGGLLVVGAAVILVARRKASN